jgi:hypothetical protein
MSNDNEVWITFEMTESDGQNFLAAIVQELKETDFERRLDFCHFTRTQMYVDNNFNQKILFSDEAKFSNNGIVCPARDWLT